MAEVVGAMVRTANRRHTFRNWPLATVRSGARSGRSTSRRSGLRLATTLAAVAVAAAMAETVPMQALLSPGAAAQPPSRARARRTVLSPPRPRSRPSTPRPGGDRLSHSPRSRQRHQRGRLRRVALDGSAPSQLVVLENEPSENTSCLPGGQSAFRLGRGHVL